MNKETEKTKVKNPFYQVNERLFDEIEIERIYLKYGFQGIGIWLKIELKLLANNNVLENNFRFISTKKSEKNIIEDIIENTGLYIVDKMNNTFSSWKVKEQLTQRGKISEMQTAKVNTRWQNKRTKNKLSENNSETKISNDNISKSIEDESQKYLNEIIECDVDVEKKEIPIKQSKKEIVDFETEYNKIKEEEKLNMKQ